MLSSRADAKLFVYLIAITVLASILVLSKATRGYIVAFRKADINRFVLRVLVGVQTIGSLLLAFIIPNNYLNEFEIVKNLYEQNELWIPVTIFFLLLIFVAFFGGLFTLITRRFIPES